MVTHLPPLAPLNYPQAKCIGEVLIHPHAVIASGVLLWAEPGSRLEIGAGACIGMGTILHASHGTMLIATGASLGAGVLFIGSGEIGAQACVGAATTIINTSVAAGTVIQPGSLLGDRSRQAPILVTPTAATPIPPIEEPQFVVESEPIPIPQGPDVTPVRAEPSNQFELHSPQPPDPDAPTPTENSSQPHHEQTKELGLVTETITETTETATKTIYGQVYVNQMLKQMFNRNT